MSAVSCGMLRGVRSRVAAKAAYIIILQSTLLALGWRTVVPRAFLLSSEPTGLVRAYVQVQVQPFHEGIYVCNGTPVGLRR